VAHRIGCAGVAGEREGLAAAAAEIELATRYHYDSHHQLRQHIQTFLDAYNFAKRLKTLNGLTPFESVCKAWTKEPNRFKYDPVQLTSGLHT